MDDLFNEIEKALDSKLFHMSLGITLTLPDICAALESDDGQAAGYKYRTWYDKYVGNKFMLSAYDCYKFRCSFLHQGSTMDEKSNFSRIIFVEPGSCVFHNNVLNDVLNIDVEIFCHEIIMSVKAWLKEMENNENYQRNSEKSFKRYPNGLAPYIVGIPVYG